MIKNDITICISTFKARVSLLENLLNDIRSIDSEIPIIVSVNGEPDEKFDESYRVKILTLAASIPYTSVTMFGEFRSLSKLWNSMIVASTTEYCYILNDDLEFKNETVFEKIVRHSNSTKEEFFLCPHHSFSHFVITKSMAHKLGYFDERLLGIGEEDGDMLWRYLKQTGANKINGINGLAGIGNLGVYEGHSKKMKVHIQNKAKFNQDFIYKEKYLMDNDGLKGMFDYTMKEVIPNIIQYPYEEFFRKNKQKILQ